MSGKHEAEGLHWGRLSLSHSRLQLAVRKPSRTGQRIPAYPLLAAFAKRSIYTSPATHGL